MTERTAKLWYRQWWAIALLIAAVLVITGVVTAHALGLRTVTVEEEPLALPTSHGFDYRWWDEALGRWVQDGLVDYEAVRAEERDLRRFIATLAVAGPGATPARFSTEPERLAYYLNAYNALVLLGVVQSWPIESVQDVHGWLNPRDGFGFFYGLRFPLDGRSMNLYDLENGIIRGFRDARIHAALNCASISCPALSPFAFDPAVLDEQLDEVTRRFASGSRHVSVDWEAREIRLSAIFDWYRPDFEEHARRLGRPATVLDFIMAFADEALGRQLERAREAELEVVFRPYDWGLNRL